MTKKIAGILTVLVAVCLLAAGRGSADQPLTKDDVTLLLLGGSPSEKIIILTQQRGVDFRMAPELAKKFKDLGASDELIKALEKAGEQPSRPKPAAPTPAKVEPAAAPLAAPPAASAPAPGAPSAQPPSGHAPGESSQASQPQDVQQKISQTLAELSSSPAAPKVEDLPLAPPFTLVALGGQRIDLESYTGKVVLLDFWATWCPPCRTEIPEFTRLQNEYYVKGLRVVGVAVGEEKETVSKFYHQLNMNYPVALVTPEVRKMYGGLHNLPTTLLIGRNGRIYSKVEGAPVDLDMFERTIQRLLTSPARQEMAAVQGGGATADPPKDGPPAQQASASAPPGAQTPQASASQAVPAAASAQPVSSGSQPAAKPASKPAVTAPLSEPSPAEVQKIIQEFAAKEKLFKLARDNYTYHQINKLQELSEDNEVVGVYEQEWDILYDDAGNRIERVTYAPENTLKGLIITREDVDAMRNITPFVLTTDELPDYDIKYLGHVKVDEITTYVFSVRPKEIKKGRQYFQGIVWVDDRDLQIVKSEGKQVPEVRTSKGQENLFPRFTTWREQIDGKYWFPTYTMADDTLYFSNSAPVHVKEIIRYTNYKQFKAGVRILSVEAIDKSKDKDQNKTTPAPAPPPKP